jgi:hypothetical protein
MSDFRRAVRWLFMAWFALAFWVGSGQEASAQVLLAQSGVAKTILGWLLTLLAITLGLLVVCRPSSRKDPDVKERKARK